MPSTNLSGKTKADLVMLAELSGLMTAVKARRLTKAELLEFLAHADKENAAKLKKSPDVIKKTEVSDNASAKVSTDDNLESEAVRPESVKDEQPAANKKKPAVRKAKSEKSSVKSAKIVKPSVRTKKNAAGDSAEKADVVSGEISKEKVVIDKESKLSKTSRGRRKTVSAEKEPKSLEAKISEAKTSEAKSPEKKTSADKNSNLTRRKSPRKKSVDTVEKVTQKSAEAVQQVNENLNEADSKDSVEAKAADNNAAEKHNRQQNQPDQRQNIHRQNVQNQNIQPSKQKRPLVEQGEMVAGTLEIMPDGYGFLRKDNYLQGTKDIYVPPQYIRRFNLRTGDFVTGPGKLQREGDRYQALLYVKEVNGLPPDKMVRRPQFDKLTPIYPDERYRLETTRNELSTRIIDLAAPIGKGQRGMIVSPPKAGKTIILQKLANAISINNPEVKLIVLLIDERPEEVTDMQRSIKGEVVYSTFDKTPENHVKVTELVLERAMRLVELKQDVVILLDSMTRLARAYNLTINPTGRTLSGGLDPGALYGPKRFFGSARNIENGGSLTIIATSLIETGSRMDEVIFEEFKGTGNMEVYLDRKLSEKRIFPAIDINRSGTRREELLMTEKELDSVWTIRKAFGQLDTAAVTETIINLLLKTQNNEHFISSINVSFNDKNLFESMRGNRTGGNSPPQNGINGGSR